MVVLPATPSPSHIQALSARDLHQYFTYSRSVLKDINQQEVAEAFPRARADVGARSPRTSREVLRHSRGFVEMRCTLIQHRSSDFHSEPLNL